VSLSLAFCIPQGSVHETASLLRGEGRGGGEFVKAASGDEGRGLRLIQDTEKCEEGGALRTRGDRGRRTQSRRDELPDEDNSVTAMSPVWSPRGGGEDPQVPAPPWGVTLELFKNTFCLIC
jgi:hypothetical protein